jgi:adenosine phosphosulfate reductase beta subunit
MPSFVITEKCDGCKAQDRTACQYICPNDLMVLDREKNKAYNRATGCRGSAPSQHRCHYVGGPVPE